MKRSKRAFWLALAAALAMTGCDDNGKGKGDVRDDGGAQDGTDGDGADGNPDGTDDSDGTDLPPPPDAGNDGSEGTDAAPITGAVQGTVYDTSSPPSPLEGVRITGPGGVTATTDANGAFTLEGVAVGATVSLFAKDSDHTIGVRTVNVSDGATSYTEFFLKAVVKAVFDPEKGGEAKDESTGARASFPANSLQRKDGSTPKGSATVAIAPIDVSKGGAEGKSAPTPVAAVGTDNKNGLLAGRAPVEVRVEDGDKKALQIKGGKNAEVDIPVSPAFSDTPDEIDLWSLDEVTGNWVLEGKAKKKVNDKGQKVYRATLAHLSWWNVGDLVENVTCVRGCVETPSGAPAVGASVSITGVDNGVRTSVGTDAEGCFYVDVAQQAQYALLAAGVEGVSDAKTITSDAEAKRVEDDPQACKATGKLSLVARPDGNTCPSGYSECNGTCVDLSSDYMNCGACSTYCNGRVDAIGVGPSGSSCINGQCVCPPGWLECDGSCINALNNRNDCGTTCQNRLYCEGQNEICENGACVTLVCDTNLEACEVGNGPGCVDTDTNLSHCGGCNEQCAYGAETQGAECVAGVCGCSTGLTQCTPDVNSPNQYTCADTQNDTNNCGGCYHDNGVIDEAVVCSQTQTCMNGSCVEIMCAVQTNVVCDRECVDTNTDERYCGDCYTRCNGQGQTCVSGVCECPGGQSLCSGGEFGACTDTNTDPNNCGGCSNDGGVGCADTQACVSGTCTDVTCNGNQVACNHACLDVMQGDENNCGGCGYYCGGTCNAGACVCPLGQELCGGGSYLYCVQPGNCIQ